MADLKKQIEISADASGVETGVAKAKRSLADLGASAVQSSKQAADSVASVGDGGDAAAKKVDTATRSIARSLERQIALLQAGEKGSRAFTEELARIRGADAGALKPLLDQLDALKDKQKLATDALRTTEPAVQQLGVSAKQTAAALRGVPAQLTDIAVSLQGGQNPFTVLLQQGGQLKDMFGGVGNAARALGGYVATLIGPVSAVAAVVAALAIAYSMGAQESTAFNRAIVLSGNATGATVSSLQGMAASIAQVTGTQRAAAAALAVVAESGVVGAENLEFFTRAAIRFEAVGGGAVEKTVEKFAQLGKSPLEASIKLNEHYGYLTESVYKQIRALTEQGKTTEAANLAQKTFADTIDARASAIVANVGYIESAWNAVTRAVKGAGDAILNVGRDTTLAEQIKTAEANLRNLQDRNASLGIKDGLATQQAGAQLAALKAMQAGNEANAKAIADGNEKMKARIAFDEAGVKFLSDELKLQRALTAEKNLAVAAGASEAEIATRLALVRQSFNKTGAAGTGQEEVAGLRARIVEEQNLIARLRERGVEALKLTAGEQAVLKIQEELKTSITGVARAQKLKALAAAEDLAAVEKVRVGEEKRVAGLKKSDEALQKAIEATDSSGQAIQQKALAQEAANSVYGKGKTAIEEMVTAQLQLQLAEAESSDIYAPAYVASLRQKVAWQERFVAALKVTDYKAIANQQAEYTRQVAEEAALYQDEIGLLGLTAREREKVVAVRQQEIKLAKELDAINKSGATPEEKASLRAQAEATAAQAKATAAAKADVNAISDIINSVDRTAQQVWTNIFEGGQSAFKKIGNVIKASVLDLLYQLTIKKFIINVGAQVTGAATGASGSASGAGGALGSISNLFSTGSTVYSAISTGFAGALGSAVSTVFGGVAGNAAIAASLTGSASSAVAAASAASIAGGGAAAGAGAGIGAGVGSALAAIPVYGWIALAAAAAFSVLKGGESRMGGQYDTQSGSAQLLSGPDGGLIADGGVKQTINATVSGINDLFKTLGSSASVAYFNAGLETSENGKGFTYAGGALADGTQFGNGFGTGYLNNRGDKTAEEALAEFQVELQQTVIQSLQAASDVPKTIKDMLSGVDANALDAAGVKAVLEQVNAVIVGVQSFGTAMDALPFANLKNLSFDATASLIQLAGGLESLNTKISGYYKNYYSDSERIAVTAASVSKALGSLGLVMPDLGTGAEAARAQFRAYVDAQDLSTEAGRSTYNALLSIADAFAEITPATTSAAQALAALNQQALELASNNASSAYSALDRAVAAQRESADLTRSLAAEQVTAIQSVFNTLASSVSDLYGTVGSTVSSQGAQGQAFIVQALATAKATGYLPDSEVLSKAITDARAGLDATQYTSQFEADRARLVLAGTLSQLQAAAGDQLTSAEQALALAQKQVDALDSMLTVAKQQLDAANGIDVSVQSVADALKGFDLSLQALISTRTQQGLATGSVPGFAGGGDHAGGLRFVGEQGIELEATGPARIWSASQTRAMLAGAEPSAALVAEVRNLREENRAQSLAMVQMQQRMAKLLERWDGSGLPAERETA